MDKKDLNRRQFLTVASAASLAAAASSTIPAYGNVSKKAGKLAILGGKPVRTKGWYGWPIWDKGAEEAIVSVLRSGNWFRGRGTEVTEFEKKYAELMGAKRCLATASGTTALLIALHILGVDAGDPILIRDWANAGQLPFFEELEKNSAIFPIKNDTGFFVGSVWPSYATGKTPDQHHWYCYRQYDPESYRDIPFDSSMLQAEPFWGAISRQGIRVGVVDVPLLPVVSGIDGFQVSEWGSHDTFLGGLKTWPVDLADRIREKFGPDPVGTCDDITRTPGGFTQFVARLEERIGTRERMITELLQDNIRALRKVVI